MRNMSFRMTEFAPKAVEAAKKGKDNARKE